jgi:hypothetical protein
VNDHGIECNNACITHSSWTVREQQQQQQQQSNSRAVVVRANVWLERAAVKLDIERRELLRFRQTPLGVIKQGVVGRRQLHLRPQGSICSRGVIRATAAARSGSFSCSSSCSCFSLAALLRKNHAVWVELGLERQLGEIWLAQGCRRLLPPPQLSAEKTKGARRRGGGGVNNEVRHV